ncbi:uncharacterized protein LOC105204923 [Solenopsis invicta]|uniref:uncharacterized protein LOC105204923 n=1 Tax=Solenopsis invicta TaxID=13686 RepID=UPI0005962F65|nr:uncharacterized protein LOC105204923 [Solenopsis invicta]XP_011172506.1 uncharacterized protein LOC105204923 [Solenopsis invicta]XP_025995498.1 uncharacterized protein LOC105204923 [Solenopsis invicta]XP_039308445.1 uncharacterized protein LOC105204923 [Solenopsis invicta]
MAYIMSKTTILCRPVFCKKIISGPINKNTFARSYQQLTNKTNAWAEQKYKQKDDISNSYRLVYREHSLVNLVTTAAYHVGWLGFFTSTFGLAYLIYEKPPVREKEPEDPAAGQKFRPLTAAERVLMLFVSFALSTLLVVGSRTIPFRIYHDSAEKIFKAVFVSRILGKKQIETFAEGTAVPIFSRKHLGDLLFKVNGRTILLDKECFPVPYIREQMICKSSTAK